MLYTVKIMRGKTTLKQFAVIADGDTTLQKFAADALGGQADDTAVMKKFGVCDSAEFARDSMTEFRLDLLDKVTVNDLSGKFVLIMCREKEIAPTPMSSFFDKLSTGGGTFNHLPPKPTGGRYDMKIKGALIGVLETQGLGFQIQDVDMSGSDMLKDVTAALQYVLPFDDAGVFKARSVHLPELLTSRSLGVAPSDQHHGAKKKEDRLDQKALHDHALAIYKHLDLTAWARSPRCFRAPPAQPPRSRTHRLPAFLAARKSRKSPHRLPPPQVEAVHRRAARALDRARQDVDEAAGARRPHEGAARADGALARPDQPRRHQRHDHQTPCRFVPPALPAVSS